MPKRIEATYEIEKRGRKWFSLRLVPAGWKAQLLITDITKELQPGQRVSGHFTVLKESPYQVELIPQEVIAVQQKEEAARKAARKKEEAARNFQRQLEHCGRKNQVDGFGFQKLRDILQEYPEPEWQEQYDTALQQAKERDFYRIAEEITSAKGRLAGKDHLLKNLEERAKELGGLFPTKFQTLYRDVSIQKFESILGDLQRAKENATRWMLADLNRLSEELGHDYTLKFRRAEIQFCRSYSDAVRLQEGYERMLKAANKCLERGGVPKVPKEDIQALLDFLDKQLHEIAFGQFQRLLSEFSKHNVYEPEQVQQMEHLHSILSSEQLSETGSEKWASLESQFTWMQSFQPVPLPVKPPEHVRDQLKKECHAKWNPVKRAWYVAADQREKALQVLEVELNTDEEQVRAYLLEKALSKSPELLTTDELYALFPKAWNWLKKEWVTVDGAFVGERKNFSSSRKNASIVYPPALSNWLAEANEVVIKSGSHKHLVQDVFSKVEEGKWLHVYAVEGSWMRCAYEEYLEHVYKTRG